MAKRLIRLEVHRETEDIIPELLNIGRSRMSVVRQSVSSIRKSRASKLISKKFSIMKPIQDDVSVTSTIPTRIFLYIQLRDVIRLPNYEHLKLQLDSEAHLTKLQDHYTTDRFIDLTDNEKPTFSMTITQDCYDNINELCDSPLRITMYRIIKHRKRKLSETSLLGDNQIDTIIGEVDAEEGEEEDIEEEELVPISQGFVDLLYFFCKKRTFSEIKTFLYPLHKSEIQVDIGTAVATWHLYTLLPLLKNLTLTNIVYISFESIYNFSNELADECEDLIAELSFESKVKGSEHVKVKLCSFSAFSKSIIDEQNVNLKWEKMKNKDVSNEESLAVQTGFKVRIYSLFNELLSTEGVDFHFDDIDKANDAALLCNSMHRFLLNKNVTQILEEVIGFNEQELIVDIYRSSNPDEILLQGKLDLSVFLYPRVNSCRFAVELRSPNYKPIAQTSAKGGSSAKSAKQKSKSVLGISGATTPTMSSDRPKPKQTFCIINICLLSPITEDALDIQSLNENLMQSEKLKRCSPLAREIQPRPREVICEETYREFDELVETLIQYIVKNNLNTLVGGKNFLCCNLGNLVNKMMKIMACDFNVRFPTKTNLEFTNLMTTVYMELEKRMYNLVQECDEKNLSQCCVPNDEAENIMIRFMTSVKYTYEVGDFTMSNFLYEKMKNEFPKNVYLYFYTYLRDIEIKNFEAARQYHSRPMKEKVLNIEYFCDFADIYMNYMEELEDDEMCDKAFEHLLRKLETFNHNYNRVIDGWILLHCLYKNCKYQPGITYTRWKYENLCDYPRKEMPDIPKSRWEIYNSCVVNFQTKTSICFYETVKLFLCLGLYKFADVVYANIAKENTEIERYYMSTTFKILLNEVEKKFVAKTFPTEKMLNGERLKAFNVQINGNLDYFRESVDLAMKSYSHLLDMHSLEDVNEFRLGLLRYGYNAMENENFEQAVLAFDKCCTYTQGNKLVPYFQMGKALYKLGRLPEALNALSESTKFEMHVPDIWGYLALINLKLGQNFNALECWKYAKLEPENIISDDVLVELSKIPFSDVFLYVDMPMSL